MSKQFIRAAVAFCAVLLAVPAVSASAMHVMEGYLSPGWCVLWGVLCIPFLIWGGIDMSRRINSGGSVKLLLALAGAFVFIISSLKIPSVTGSCSHPTGTGLGAVLFGAPVMSVLGIIVLLFQALLLGHGGLTTLGANTFSMAVAGPFLSWGLYALLKKLKAPAAVSVFLAAALGDLFTYVVTSFQLAMCHSDGNFAFAFGKFMLVFAPTQLPIAIAEGILSVMIFNIIEKYCGRELKFLGVLVERRAAL